MGKINLLVANAGATFSEDHFRTFHSAADAAEKYMTENYGFDYEVDVVIAQPTYMLATIPEDGICGRTYNSRLIVIVVDPNQAPVTEDFVFESICHEMSHSLRWEKVAEYSDTLFRGAVFEGLALVMEERAMQDTGRANTQFFLQEIQKTDQSMVDDLLVKLERSLDSDDYDYDAVFFAGNDELPRWAGYRLGYFLVKKYLEQTGIPLSQAILTSYDAFKS